MMAHLSLNSGQGNIVNVLAFGDMGRAGGGNSA